MMFRPFGGYADRRMAGMQISEREKKKSASIEARSDQVLMLCMNIVVVVVGRTKHVTRI